MSSAASSAFSYLPNPTRNPARDFAHSSYRLASFCALPAVVPVSRIRLADAGFYYQGHGDEVVCYSCGARHSGWRQGDNPMQVHRRLSPECQHVASRDREVATVAPLGAYGGGGGDHTCRETAGSDRPTEVASSARQTASVVNNSSTLRTADVVSRSTPARTPGASNVSEDGESPATTPQQPSASVPSSSPGSREPPPASAPAPSQSPAPSNARFVSSDGGGRPPSTTTFSLTAAVSTATSESSREETAPWNFASQSIGTSSSSRSEGSGAEGGSSLFPRAGLDLGGAVYPMYQDMQSRRRTFQTWDDTRAPPLDLIILCGMFYAGYADCVRCFYCGVGLKHWLPTDDVWTEHVRWRPGCQYLRAIKGDDFIKDTQQRLALQGSASLPTETSSRPQGQGQTPAAVPPPPRAPSTSAPALSSLPVVTAPGAGAVATLTAASAAPTTATSTADSSTATYTTDSTSVAADSPTSDHQPSLSSVFPADRSAGSSRVVGNEAEDGETVNRLQAENEALSQRLRCRVCRTSAVDTILMPCGHLVCCETCARSTRTCPLCHETIRATARVHMN